MGKRGEVKTLKISLVSASLEGRERKRARERERQKNKKNVVRTILQTVRVIQKFLMISLAEQKAKEKEELEKEKGK